MIRTHPYSFPPSLPPSLLPSLLPSLPPSLPLSLPPFLSPSLPLSLPLSVMPCAVFSAESEVYAVLVSEQQLIVASYNISSGKLKTKVISCSVLSPSLSPSLLPLPLPPLPPLPPPIPLPFQKPSNRVSPSTLQKYLVKMTTIAGYCSFRVHRTGW